MGPYREKEYPLFLIVAVLLVVLAAIYWPWISPARELFRQEGFFAAIAADFEAKEMNRPWGAPQKPYNFSPTAI